MQIIEMRIDCMISKLLSHRWSWYTSLPSKKIPFLITYEEGTCFWDLNKRQLNIDEAMLAMTVNEELMNIYFDDSRMQIEVTVAVDFTKSNGDPSKPDSLHCMNSKTPNPYAKAIAAVVSILEYYDT